MAAVPKVILIVGSATWIRVWVQDRARVRADAGSEYDYRCDRRGCHRARADVGSCIAVTGIVTEWALALLFANDCVIALSCAFTSAFALAYVLALGFALH